LAGLLGFSADGAASGSGAKAAFQLVSSARAVVMVTAAARMVSAVATLLFILKLLDAKTGYKVAQILP
jgi:hypothetical protein